MLGEKPKASLLKSSKTPEKWKVTHKINARDEGSKRNKTPGIRFALNHGITNQGNTSVLNQNISKKDIIQGFNEIPGANPNRSRNRQPLGDTDSDLIVRTKPEERNVSLLVPQQLLSTRKEAGYEERRNSGIKQKQIKIFVQANKLRPKSQYRTFYPKQNVVHIKDGDEVNKSIGNFNRSYNFSFRKETCRKK